MPFQLTEVIFDTDLRQYDPFTIFRSTGQFGPGGFISKETKVPVGGIITVATPQDLQMVPEGDRVPGSMHIITQARLYVTHMAGTAGPVSGVSDQLEWDGNRYRVQAVEPWKDFGFWSAIAVRMVGA